MSIKAASLYADLSAKDGLTPALKNAKGSLTSFGGGLKDGLMQLAGFASAAALGGMAVVKLSKFIGDSVNAAAESETVMSHLNATLQSTGRVAEISAKQIAGAATGLMGMSTFDDEEIVSAYNTLLKFESIPTGNMQGIVKIAMDMAAAMGGDLASNTDALGRALETGVIPRSWGFSAALKEQFTAQVKAGDSAKALTLMMDELNKRYGGQAAAQMDTYAGKLKNVTNQWGEVKEALGGWLLENTDNSIAMGLMNKIIDDNKTKTHEAAIEAEYLAASLAGETSKEHDYITTTQSATGATKELTEAEKEQAGAMENAARAVVAFGTGGTLADIYKSSSEELKQYNINLQYFQNLLDSGTGTVEYYAQALDDVAAQFGVMSPQYVEARDKLEQISKDTGIAAESTQYYKDKIKEATAAIDEQIQKQVYQLTISHLNADTQLDMARQMGLISEMDYAVAASIQALTDQYDANKDSLIDSSEGAGVYAKKIEQINDAIAYAKANNIPITQDYILNYVAKDKMKDEQLALLGGKPLNIPVNLTIDQSELSKKFRDADIASMIGEVKTEVDTELVIDSDPAIKKLKKDLPAEWTVKINFDVPTLTPPNPTAHASGGSFKGWGMVGDAPGGGITPFTEWVYAPYGATVYNSLQMMGSKSAAVHKGGTMPTAPEKTSTSTSDAWMPTLARYIAIAIGDEESKRSW